MKATSQRNLTDFSGDYKLQYEVCKGIVWQHLTLTTRKFKRAPGTSRRCLTLPIAACWKCSSQQVAAVLLLGRLPIPNCCLNWWGIRSHQVQRHYSNLRLLLLRPLPSPLFQHWITFSHSLTCQFKTRSIFVGTLFKTFCGEVGEKKPPYHLTLLAWNDAWIRGFHSRSAGTVCYSTSGLLWKYDITSFTNFTESNCAAAITSYYLQRAAI